MADASLKSRHKIQVWIYAENRDQRAFLVFRLTPKRGDFWQPVTGGVEPGEATLQAADRESDEESGLEFESGSRPAGYEFEFEWNDRRFHEEVFFRKARWDSRESVKLDPHEHVECEWVSAEEASRRVKYDSNREGLRCVLSALKSN